MISSFIDIDLRKTGRTTGKSFEDLFSLSSVLETGVALACLYRLLWIGLQILGGSGRLNVLFGSFDNFDINGDDNSASVLSTSKFFVRLILFSVRLMPRRNNGVRFVVALMFPLIIVLNDVGNGVFSSSDSISTKPMQSSSIDSIESDDKLLNVLKQLILFGEIRFCVALGDGVFGGDRTFSSAR